MIQRLLQNPEVWNKTYENARTEGGAVPVEELISKAM